MENRVNKTIIIDDFAKKVGPLYKLRKVFEEDSDIKSIIPATEYIPSKGDKIYFYPDCNIPRFKIKQFCEKYGASVVKFPDKATVKIAGENTIKSFIEPKAVKEISMSDFTAYMHKYTNIDITDIIKDVDSQHVYMYYSVDGKFESACGAKLKTVYTSRTFIKEDCEEKFMALLSDTNLFDEKEILKRLNTGAVMDNEQYVSIQRLFDSKDVENHKLAIEMMANCDFEKSSVYLLLLIHNFGYTIYDAPNRTHVNFKSLLKFFNIREIRRLDLDDIIACLLERKLLSAHNLNVMMPLLQEYLENGNTSDYVKIKNVEVTEEILTGLEVNILDKEHNTTILEYDLEELNPHI